MFFRKRKHTKERITIEGFDIEVSYKPIKNLYLKVSRKTGEIRVSVPSTASLKVIRSFIKNKKTWIEKHLANQRPPEPTLKYEAGELHKYFGSEIPLKINYVNKNINAYLHNNAIVLKIKSGYSIEKREKVVDQFYRKELNQVVKKMIRKWEPIMGVEVKDYGIKKMKTRWGTCNIRDQRIWLNLHLAKEKPEVIEMVVVHEMVHLLERLHSKRFYQLMDKHLPDWKERSLELDGRVC